MTKSMVRWTFVALALVLAVGIAARPQAPASIGLVNVPRVLEETPGFEEAKTQFEQEMQGYQREVEGMQNRLDSMIRAYEQQQAILSNTAKQNKATEIRAFQERIQTRLQELETQTEERQRELLEPIENRVQSVIDGLRAERDLAVIIDVAAQGSGIIAANPALDLTEAVLRRVRGNVD